MKSLVKNLLLRRGMVLSRPPGQFDVWPVKLAAAKQRGLELRGATECLVHAQALLLDLSFFPLQQGAPLAGDVVCFLRDQAFRIYDIPALWHRPLDGALAQGDFLFLKQGHPLLTDNRWSTDS